MKNNNNNKRNRNNCRNTNTTRSSKTNTAKNDRTDDYKPEIVKDKGAGFKSKDKSNDVSWYALNKELLDSAASLSFGEVLGGTMPYGSMQYGTPGVMALRYVPTYNSTALTTAARNIYSFVRHANSGASNYDAPDLMMYISAVDQAFSYIAFMRRVYGLARVYDQKNRYYPKAIIESMGVNFKSIMENLSNLWFYIDQVTARASALWIPDNIPVVERHFWMNSNVYMDGDSNKAQTYVFAPTYVYKYNPTLTSTGGGLEPVQIFTANGAMTFSQMQLICEDLLNVLFEDEDIGIMGGDILKAYGKEHIYSLSPIDAGYTVLPTRSDEVLTQIHNAVPVSWNPPQITQDAGGNIVIGASETQTITGRQVAPVPPTLDFFQAENPTPEQVMVATRLNPGAVNVGHAGPSDNFRVMFIHPGTELVTSVDILGLKDDGSTVSYGDFSGIMGASDFADIYVFIAAYSTFDWAPFVYIGSYDAEHKTQTVACRIGDVENYTFIDGMTVRKLNTTAIYSEYGIPTM